jgi:hypothetical protein
MKESKEVIRDGNTTFSKFRHNASTTDPRFTSRHPKVRAKILVPAEYCFPGYDAVQSDTLHGITSQKTAILLRESSTCVIIFSENFIKASTKQNMTLLVHDRSSLAEKLCFVAHGSYKIQPGLCLQSYSVTPGVTNPSTSHSSTATRQMALPFIQPFPLPFYIFIESLHGISNEITVQYTTIFLTSFELQFSIRFTGIYILYFCHILERFRLVLHIYYYHSPTHPHPQHNDVGCAPAGLAKSSNVLITLNSRLRVM